METGVEELPLQADDVKVELEGGTLMSNLSVDREDRQQW